MKLIVFIFLAFTSLTILSAEKVGVTIPDTIDSNGSKLILNGIGVRRATFLRIKVYVGGLYLSKKANTTKEVLSSPYPKYISMNFIRDVDKEDLQKAWLEGLEAAVKKEERAALMKSFSLFNSYMVDIKKGQSILITFTSDGVDTTIAGVKKPVVADQSFSHALLSVWFINPRDEELRDELLGKN